MHPIFHLVCTTRSLLDPAISLLDLYLSLCVQRLLFNYLLIYVVSKPFLKLFQTLQFWFNSFLITHVLFLRGRPLAGVVIWRFLALWHPLPFSDDLGSYFVISCIVAHWFHLTICELYWLWRHNGYIKVWMIWIVFILTK